jgi:hypothetical protein
VLLHSTTPVSCSLKAYSAVAVGRHKVIMPDISYTKQYNIYANINITAALRNANFMYFTRARVAYKA